MRKKAFQWAAASAGVLLALVLCLAVSLRAVNAGNEIPINGTNFPDEVFRQCVQSYDTNGNGSLSESEIAAAKYLIPDSPNEIRDLTGIEYLTGLTTLDLTSDCINVKSVNLSKLTKLENLSLEGYWSSDRFCMSELDLHRMTNLKTLYIGSCGNIRYIDLSKNTKLESLTLRYCGVCELDVSKLTQLKQLILKEIPITTLDVSKNSKLQRLECVCCALKTLKLGNTVPEYLDCSENDLLRLDLSKGDPKVVKCAANRLTNKTILFPQNYFMVGDSFWGQSVWNDDGNPNISIRTLLYPKNSNTGELFIKDYHASAGEDVTLTLLLGEYSTEHQTRKAGTSFKMPEYTYYDEYFSEFGHDLEVLDSGWVYSPRASVPDVHPGDTVTLYRDTVMYFKIVYALPTTRFDANGGTGKKPHDVQITAGGEFAIPESSLAREGYYFMGWSNNKNGSGKVYKSYDIYTTGSADAVLYAVWKPRNNKITFDKNGGSGTAPATIYVLSGKTATIPKASITRTDYWFLGWSTDPNATTATYKSGNTISVTKDTVLYAVWKEVARVRLYFNSNDGGKKMLPGTPATIAVTPGKTATVPKSSMVRDGYWFLGWSENPSATSATYKSGDKIVMLADKYLYAVWKKKN